MATKRIDKNEVKRLLETTDRGYRDIAAVVGCSHQAIAQLAIKWNLNTVDRDKRSRTRAQSPRRVIGTHGVKCPKCASEHVRKNGRSKKYGTQCYRCVACCAKFMTEYRWITSGDRDRHLAEIAHCSGYARPDMVAHWQRIRQRVWPYLQGDYSDTDAMLRVVNDAIPRTVPEHMRADICQDALVAILECEIEQTAVTLKPFIAKWFQQNSIGYRPLSLDAPSRRREGQTVGQEMGLY
jgi:hypothetical protein